MQTFILILHFEKKDNHNPRKLGNIQILKVQTVIRSPCNTFENRSNIRLCPRGGGVRGACSISLSYINKQFKKRLQNGEVWSTQKSIIWYVNVPLVYTLYNVVQTYLFLKKSSVSNIIIDGGQSKTTVHILQCIPNTQATNTQDTSIFKVRALKREVIGFMGNCK